MRQAKRRGAAVIVGLALVPFALPRSAIGCSLHWALGLPEPVGVWPAELATSPTAPAQNSTVQTDTAAAASAAIAEINAADSVNDAAVTSWLQNPNNTKGFSTNSVVNSVVNKVNADVQTVAYTSTNVYVKATGIPSHTLGSYGSDPAIPTNVNRTVDIPRNPVVNNGTKTNTGLGAIGVAVNGAVFYNAADAMSYNNANVWHQNANVFEASTFDGGPGHPSPINGQTVTTSTGTAPAGNYHYHQAPTALINEIDPGNSGQHASPVIGFAFDGFPIFGPYGYANADGTGGITLMSTSYQKRNITTRTTLPNGTTASSAGPDVSATYPLGSYLEDYSYVAGSGTLDQYNGRFAVAPGYPSGTYGYYVTETAGGLPTYPYVVGPQYYGVVQSDDLAGGTITVPANAVVYTPAVPEPSLLGLAACAIPTLLKRRSRG
ncbi:MAG TPA: YHYH protein [Tepidisphaeraceae bacterium]|nr:YHYH protein [Tepidisphaeraceae bacterium]